MITEEALRFAALVEPENEDSPRAEYLVDVILTLAGEVHRLRSRLALNRMKAEMGGA